MKISNAPKLIIAIAVCEFAGIIGSLFTTPSIGSNWYAGLTKPVWTPPSWVFAPVWILLFALMGISLYFIWHRHALIRANGTMARTGTWKWAVGLFFFQLILNVFWSIIFFGLHSPGAAFIEIIFLWLVIIATIILFSKISKAAAWLLVPYILWVSFAGFLNYSIWQLSSNAAEPISCTQEAKLCPDGSAVGRTGPNCEFAPCPSEASCEGGACPGNIVLPKGYSLDSYNVEKVLEIACVRNDDCETPSEYLIQSRCPFVSLCLDNKCAVVCPGTESKTE